MSKVVTYPLAGDFIGGLASFIKENFLNRGSDLSRLAVVFGGRRPHLFLAKELSKRTRRGVLAPSSFSIDEFVEYSLAKKESFSKISDLDAAFLIYQLARQQAPDILEGREAFSQFLPWAKEILGFFEQLDLEGVAVEPLKEIQLSASIGYDVPENINALLAHMVSLRDAFHKALLEKKTYTRGLIYLLASQKTPGLEFGEFDKILFCNFFYLHKSEEALIKGCCEKEKALLFFQGDSRDWSVLQRVSKNLNQPIYPSESLKPTYDLRIYAGFDLHSQVCLVRERLKKIKNLDKTVILLPEPKAIIPLLSEISSCTDEFNVSLGYPLKRSALYSLFECIFKAQETKKGQEYYTRDYLRVLSHPLVKNLNIKGSSSVSRILVHKVEEVLVGIEETPLGGSLFVELDDVVSSDELFVMTKDMTEKAGIKAQKSDLKDVLRRLHYILFEAWEDIRCFDDFSSVLRRFLDLLVHSSPLDKYPLNLKIVERMFDLQEELEGSSFKKERFPREDIFKIFRNKLQDEMVSFSGSPLKGLQILGLFETRSLNFEHVIVVDTNESVLPKLKVYEPLIPRDVMLALGLNRLEKDEEIQRYQFMRLISGAQTVDLVYEKSEDKEKSRFIEELIWTRQKGSAALDVLSTPHARFEVKVSPREIKIEKKAQHITFLSNYRYSASSLNTYLSCPLRFYFQYVLGLKEKEDLLEEPEASDIGNFIHSLLELTFSKFVGRRPQIGPHFIKYFFKILDEKFELEFKKKMRSDAFLTKEILDFRLQNFLDYEARRQIERLLSVEKSLQKVVPLAGRDIRFKCKIDRIDQLKDDSLLIIDYKTGSSDIMPGKISAIEAAGGDRRALKGTLKSFQLPLYLYFTQEGQKGAVVDAALYQLRYSGSGSPLKRLFSQGEGPSEKARAMDIFMKAVESMVNEILNPRIPFVADEEDAYNCQTCPFFYLCR